MKRLNLLVYITLILCFTLHGTNSKAQNLLSQGFEGTFPPTGWQNNLLVNNGSDCGGPVVWVQSTTGSSISSGAIHTATAHGGTHAAAWNSWDIYGGGTADLVTPAINMGTYPGGTNTLTFYSARWGGDPVYVYVNTSPNITGGTLLTTLNSSTSGSWVLSTCTIPSSYTGNVYIIFHAVSSYGDDDYIDDVSVDHVGCYGTPSTSSIINVPLATPVCSGGNVTLSANEVNTAPGISTYWQQSSSASGPWSAVVGGTGANTANYTTPALASSVYYRYVDSCINSHLTAPSAAYYVPVAQSTTITGQPQNSTICIGNNAQFTVNAIGGNLTYQWQVNTGSGFNNVSGPVYSNPTAATLNITGAPVTMNGYQYRVIVSGSCGAPVTSNVATLAVGGPPTITTNPHDTTICATHGAAFNVAATGIALSYQWQVNTGSGFVSITNNSITYSGVGTNTLVINNASANMNGYQYQVIVSGACNPASSTVSTLHVNALPTIVSQPVNTSVCNTSNASFTVGATGAGLNYQWQVNTGSGFSSITSSTGGYSGFNTNTLNITGATLGMNGYLYRAIISGICAPIDTTITDTLRVRPLPPVGISAQSSTTICPSDSVNLIGLAGAGLTYQWYYNNNLIPGATRDTFRANPAGPYKVAITNTVGCTAFSPVDTVNYLPAPVSTISANGPTGFCQGGSVVLMGNLNTGVTYAWKLNGVYLSNATNTNDTAYVSGSYTLYQNNGTCGTLSAPIVVTASAPPSANITTPGAATFCAGQTVTLNANTGIGYSYQWDLNGIAQPNGSGSSFAAGVAGNYTVTVFSGPGCSTTSSMFPVSSLPSPTAAITPAGNTAICTGSSVLLNANAQSNVTYQWSDNGNPITGATATGFTATTAGSYTVKITGSNGCSATSSSVVVTAQPSVSAPVTSNHPDTLCYPDSLTLSTPLISGLTYSWYNNGTALSDTTNNLVVHTAGSYSVKVANAGCSATSSTITIAGNTRPTGSVTAMPGSICGSTPALLQAPAGSNYSYQWYIGSGVNTVAISGAFNQYYPATTPGTYNVVVSTPLGCSLTTSSVNIIAGTIPQPVIQQVGSQLCAPGFSTWQWNYNGQPLSGETSPCTNINWVGGYTVTVTNSTGCSATSAVFDVLNLSTANVNLKDDIKLYPNPATSVVNIDAPIAVNIAVMSIDGKVLIKAEKVSVINIDQLANGMYMIAIYDQDNHLLKTDKFIKN